MAADIEDRGRGLAAAIDRFVIDRGLDAAGGHDAEWRELLAALAEVRSPGYALLGRPPFLTDEWLERLAEEARALRPEAQPTGTNEGQGGQHYASPGPAARKLVVQRGWRELIARELGCEPVPPYHAGYLFYDRPGAGIVPHVDDPEFAINVILMVSRSPTGSQASATVLHPPDGPPQRVVLAPGEAVLLEADGLVHAREPMREGERVTVLTMGFTRPRTSTAAGEEEGSGVGGSNSPLPSRR
jgi:hypothetical protein